MKFVIIGRTATGKHYLAEKLTAKGLTVAKVYTTNPDTPHEECYPEVISDAQVAAIPPETMFSMNSEPNTSTFMLLSDAAEADVVILHPDDLTRFNEAFPAESLHIIHMVCLDSTQQDAIEHAHPRGYGKSLKDRQIEESPAYSQWEQRLAAKDTFGMNQMIIITLDNDYKEETMDAFIEQLMRNLKIRENVKDILRSSIDLGLISTDDTGNIIVQYLEPQPHSAAVTMDMFYDLLVNDPMHFTAVMTNWLAFATDVTAGTDAAKLAAEQADADNNGGQTDAEPENADNGPQEPAEGHEDTGNIPTPESEENPATGHPAADSEANTEQK